LKRSVLHRRAARTGRPRDETIDHRALAATIELLLEQGVEGTTVQAVAKRAGIHASAIYRRWSSPIDLIEEALFPGFDAPLVEPTGNLRADLRRFLRAYVAAFGAPAARIAAPAVLAHRQSGSGERSPEQLLRVSTRPQFQAILRAAPPGTVDPNLDADAAFDVLLGAVLVRTMVPRIAGRRPIERTLDLLIRMLAPPPPEPGG
jgi:AcrR family transcriptional regulator